MIDPTTCDSDLDIIPHFSFSENLSLKTWLDGSRRTASVSPTPQRAILAFSMQPLREGIA